MAGIGRTKTVTPTLNVWRQVADHIKRSGLGDEQTSRPLPPVLDVISVKNTSGGNWSRGACVAIKDHSLAEYDPDYPWFDAYTLSTPADANFGILRRGLKDGMRGDCAVSGRCIAKVNVLNAAHTHAIPKAGQAYLESSMIGPVKILSKSEDSGTVDCWVLLGQPIVPLLGITAEAIGRTSDGTINLVKRTATGYDAWLDGSSAQLTVEARAFWLQESETIESGVAVNVNMVEGYYLEVTVAACTVRDWDLEGE